TFFKGFRLDNIENAVLFLMAPRHIDMVTYRTTLGEKTCPFKGGGH
ncbi:unnamed protein product, partial [marine sediment metagenome]